MMKRAAVIGLIRREPPRSRLDELFEFVPAEDAQEELVYWFVSLVAWLRPRGKERAQKKFAFLRTVLENNPDCRERLARSLSELLRRTDVEWALAHAGIARHFHLGGAVRDWAVERVLPAACRTTDVQSIVRLAFRRDDLVWLGAPDTIRFVRELLDPALFESLQSALRDALVDLAHQIIAQAHAPAVRSLARDERSPFAGLYDAVVALDETGDEASANALRGRAGQCHRAIDAHRAELAERGADLNTTFVLARLEEQLARLRWLAAVRHAPSDAHTAGLVVSIVRDVSRNAQGKRLFAQSGDLLVQNLVDTAASVGRDYLDAERSTWRAAFLAGAGGGVLRAIATVIKCLLARLHLPPLYEGFFFSINYASAFCAAYLLHFTIATKLPSHTAAAIARAVQPPGGYRARLDAFLAVWRSTARLQIAGLVGNVVVTGPLAYGIDHVATRFFHQHIVSVEKGAHMLHANSALGPSFLFAALTGLFLWVSSLAGAACDNWTRTSNLTERLATNPRVMAGPGRARALPLANAIVTRIGGLVGNATLGFLLGAVPAGFAIASLPVEIRHVTVSTGSVALAIAAGAGTRTTIALGLAGLLVIATVNVVTSFVLALWLALRATRGLRASGASMALLRIGLVRWVRGRGTRVNRSGVVAPQTNAATPRLSLTG
jgi:site-specific recombinase